MECVRHKIPNSRPDYPRASLTADEEGDLIVKMHFSAKDQAPAIEFIGGSASPRLRASVAEHADGLRLSCLGHKPVHVVIVYKFFIGDAERTILRDVGLAKLLGATKNLARPAYFNFNAMACPFDVRLTYRRPFVNNRVEQLDTAVAAREPLLDWLEGLTLNVSDQKSANLYGNKMIVSVPCGKLDI